MTEISQFFYLRSYRSLHSGLYQIYEIDDAKTRQNVDMTKKNHAICLNSYDSTTLLFSTKMLIQSHFIILTVSISLTLYP